MSAARKKPDLDRPLSIVIVGASGDLARKKLIPALFALYSQDLLPASFHLFGFARTPMTDQAFREKAVEFLTCRYVPKVKCAERMDEFLSRCHFVPGQYTSADSFLDLYQAMKPVEGARDVNRLYYLAIPPSIFIDSIRSLGQAGLVHCDAGPGWSRVVMEKPFGRDRESSDVMAKELAGVFREREIYRIDHYLGKEVIQNLMVLRFANPVFDPLWTREHVESVQICWKEDIGIGNRGGYFDEFGIIRDVMQNHLLQILSLVAMEEPASLDPQAVRDEKVRVLRSIPPLALENLVIGQYRGAERGKVRAVSYTQEEGVRPDSLTPTYAAAALHIRNPRWEGVPFFLHAGKGLDARGNDIRIRFRPKARNLFAEVLPSLPANQLVIRVQPDEAIYLRIVNKVPGLKLSLEETSLNLKYQAAFEEIIPDAYECLILDAILGDKSLFIRDDELAAAWDIFTPVLHETETKRLPPEPYEFGGQGPRQARQLAARYGMECP
ncbi:MAG: glucose-6-phosphate dehydrogenase [Verrucomicrobiota bacterium]